MNEYFDPTDVQQNKAIVIISLLFGILFFLPLIACPNSQYGRFYANQGLLLFIAGAACGVVEAVIPVVGIIVGGVCSFMLFIFAIMEIVAAAKGEAKEVPIIGSYRIIK